MENKNIVKELVHKLCETITDRIENELKSKDEETISLIFDCNNDYQESQRGGVDYIFDLNNQEDLRCCVEGGLTWKEIAKMEEIDICGRNPYFFGVNHEQPRQIKSMDELIGELIMWVEEIVRDVMNTPYAYGSYSQLYTKYVSCNLE